MACLFVIKKGDSVRFYSLPINATREGTLDRLQTCSLKLFCKNQDITEFHNFEECLDGEKQSISFNLNNNDSVVMDSILPIKRIIYRDFI